MPSAGRQPGPGGGAGGGRGRGGRGGGADGSGLGATVQELGQLNREVIERYVALQDRFVRCTQDNEKLHACPKYVVRIVHRIWESIQKELHILYMTRS